MGVSLHDRRPYYYAAPLLDHHTEQQAHEEQQRTHGDGTIVVPWLCGYAIMITSHFIFFFPSLKKLGRSGPWNKRSNRYGLSMYTHPSIEISSIESPIGGYNLQVNLPHFLHYSYNHFLLISLCRIRWWIISLATVSSVSTSSTTPS